MLPVQFLDMVLDMPVVVLRQVRGSTVQKTGLLCSCSSSKAVDIPFVPQKQIHMVQTVQRSVEIPQLPLVFRWSMPLLYGSCSFSCAAVEMFLAFPQLQLVEKSPLVVFRQHKTADFPQLQFITVVVFLS